MFYSVLRHNIKYIKFEKRLRQSTIRIGQKFMKESTTVAKMYKVLFLILIVCNPKK